MAAQDGLCLAWSETPEDTFCRVVAHLYRSKMAFKTAVSLSTINISHLGTIISSNLFLTIQSVNYEGHPIRNANISVTPESMQIYLLKSTSLCLSSYVRNRCNIIKLRRKLKKYNCLLCTTKLDVDANFTENYTFVQGVGRNKVFPNL